MATFHERLANERGHLTAGPSPDEKPGGIGTVRFIAWCNGDTEQVIDRAKSVLQVVNENSACEWPSDGKWRELLPEWFVSRCAPEQTREEADRWLAWWRTLPSEEQSRVEREKAWSLDGWIYWFKPENRYWYWWDAKPLDDKALVVAVETDGWPFPSGALVWLFRAAGADKVEAEV